MGEPVRPVLVRVPERLAEKLAQEAADLKVSRHRVILDRLEHECPEVKDPT